MLDPADDLKKEAAKIRKECYADINRTQNKKSTKAEYLSKLNLFFDWLPDQNLNESIVREKNVLKKAVGKYMTVVKAKSKNAWNCFITALNISTYHSGEGFKLVKNDLPRFIETVDPKYKHQAYTE